MWPSRWRPARARPWSWRCLIAWQTLNKLADPYDKRFSTRFLVVTPGITIRDRLRVLLPNDPGNYYRAMDLVTPELPDRLQAATILVTNFHALIRREKIEAAALTKKVLAAGRDLDRFKETPVEMVRRVCNVYFRDEGDADRPWLFPQLARIARAWIEACVRPNLKDHAFVQMLMLTEYSHAAAERLYRSIVSGTAGVKRLVPILRPYEAIGSTDGISFETTKHCHDITNSHVNRVALDSGWEAKLAEVLDGMPEVVSFVKNQGLNFKIPYTYEGRAGHYVPDYLIRLRDGAGEGRPEAGDGPDDLLTLVLEVTGERKKEKQAKVATATDLWVPAVNNWGGLGRWAFLEVTDPWDAGNLIRARFLAAAR